MEVRKRQAVQAGGFSDGLSLALELAAGPLLFGLIGWALDRAAGTAPLLLLVLGVFGFVGSCCAFSYRYLDAMTREEEGKPWTRRRG